jgi:hypothetical protein
MSEPGYKEFTTTLQKEGRFTFVALPFSPRAAWGAQPRYPVTGTINDIDVRGTLGAQGQAYFLRLSAEWLRESGIEPGAEVTVRLRLAGSRLDPSNRGQCRQRTGAPAYCPLN